MQDIGQAPALAGFRRVHFVGIGGIGMSALARFLLARGYEVSGSDLVPGEQGAALAELGADVRQGHAAQNLDGAELVVVTSAASSANPEVQEARARNIPVIKRSQLLAAIANGGRGIAVAGTHGKTTTSALIGHILTEAGLDPTVLIGGIAHNLGSNARVGGDLIVVEADEYDASFLHLRPAIAVITNVEPEHLDFYGTPDRLYAAFREFAGAAREHLVVCADDVPLGFEEGDGAVGITTYGIEHGAWRAADIRRDDARLRFQLYRADGGKSGMEYATQLDGAHNVRNAVAAILVAQRLSVEEREIARALDSFLGVERRFQTRGEAGGVLVMDDYAHHPTEIRATLAALRARWAGKGGAVRLVFQPHTYSRTSAFLADFATCFGDADAVYLLDIYASREPESLRETLGISGAALADAVGRVHPSVRYSETKERAVADVLRDARPGEVVMTMGAGDVYTLGPRILDGLRCR